MRRFALLPLLLSSTALAQAPSPAQMGITQGTPQSLQVLDSTKTWAPIGAVDPTTHTFTLDPAKLSPVVPILSATGSPQQLQIKSNSNVQVLMGAVDPVANIWKGVGSAYAVDQFAGQGVTVGDFVHDDGPTIQAALNAAAVNGGTALLAGHAYWNKTQALIVPKNVRLACAAALPKNADKSARDYTANACTIYQKNGTSLDLRGEINGVGVFNDIMHFTPLPGMNRTQVMAYVASFSGTGVSIGTDPTGVTGNGSGARLINAFILGFNQCIATNYNAAQFVLHDISGDCTNGLSIQNSHDINDLSNIEFWPFATVGTPVANTSDYWPITGIASNGGSGAIRVTYGTGVGSGVVPIVTGEKLWVTLLNKGGYGAGGFWTVTAVNSTQVDLQGSLYLPTTTGTTTNGQTYIPVASTDNLAAGMNVTGAGIPAGATIGAVWRTRPAISLDQLHPATASASGVALSFTSPAYTDSGLLVQDGHFRMGTAFFMTASEGSTCRACFAFNYLTDFDIGAVGSTWVASGADSFTVAVGVNAPRLANQNAVPVALKFSGGFANIFSGTALTSSGIHILNASPSTSTNPYQVNIVDGAPLGTSSTFSTMLENGQYGGIMLRNLQNGSGGAILLDNSNAVVPTFTGNRIAATIYGTTLPGAWTSANFFLGIAGQTAPQSLNAGTLGVQATGGANVNFYAANQAVDEKYWRWSGGGVMCLQALTDAYGAPANALCVTRAANVPAAMTISASTTVASDLTVNNTIDVGAYTFGATRPLPACTTGATRGSMAYITDAPASTPYLGIIAGGGTGIVPVFCNGVNWVYH